MLSTTPYILHTIQLLTFTLCYLPHLTYCIPYSLSPPHYAIYHTLHIAYHTASHLHTMLSTTPYILHTIQPLPSTLCYLPHLTYCIPYSLSSSHYAIYHT